MLAGSRSAGPFSLDSSASIISNQVQDRHRGIRDASSHGRCGLQGLVLADEIVVEVMQGQRVDVVVDLLGKAVGHTASCGRTLCRRRYREILALNVAGADICFSSGKPALTSFLQPLHSAGL